MTSISVALAGFRWVTSPIINKLLTYASTYLGVDMVCELQELEMTVLPQFDLVIAAAEKSPHRDKLKAWLQRLKQAFYDTEDLLDEHEYNLLKHKAKSGNDTLLEEDASSMKSTIMKPFSEMKRKTSNLLPGNRKLIKKINELKAILVEAKVFREILGLPAGHTAGCSSTVPTNVVPPAIMTSVPPSKVFGRDKDRDGIVDILLSKTADPEASSTSYSSLAIVGAGGMGKSTLAQYVYNDKRIQEYFDVKMWVCISRKLDIRRHTCEIIESATNQSCPSFNNLDTLQLKLREALQQSQKFLLVLDDIWFQESDSETEWLQLLAPLVSQQAGSKLLVTSRRDTLPAAVCCKQVIYLKNVNDAEFLALFKHHAFSGAEIRGQMLHMKLERIAEKLAKQLGQCPLAAKVLGSQLSRKKGITEWSSTLNISNLSEPMGVLLWSYEKLDPHLQRCFLYCSLFPKGHKYKIGELVHLWVAEGLVDYCGLRSMEDFGKDFFNELVSGSFFQKRGSGYIMHDLLHDMAESLSREDCFRLEDDKVTEIPCTVRHLSVRVEKMERHKLIICKLHHLRTIICIDPLLDDASDLFDQTLRNLKKLRVLDLSFYNSKKLPESVGELKHLRYLNLVRTLVSELPISLCTLYHLQLLHLSDKVMSFPEKLYNLSKLRYLERFADIERLREIYLHQMPNIGKLTSLQQLREFSVQKKEGYELRQLRNLNELSGSLKVTNLEIVTGKDEALESELYKKNRLQNISLVWDWKNDMDTNDISHLDTLEGLKPPPQLNGLTINGYKSGTYPRWLSERSYFENLDFFKLDNCSALEGLPPDTELLRHCSKLELRNVPSLKTLSCLPAGLASLVVINCPLLIFNTNDKSEMYDQRENMMRTYHLVSQFALIREVVSRPQIISTLVGEYTSLKQLMALMSGDISEHLKKIYSVIYSDIFGETDEVLVKENIMAWLCCHEQKMRLIYGRSIGQPLILPSGLSDLLLSSCSITDGALAICLGDLTSLRTLSLEKIMTLTALPSEEVFQNLIKLSRLCIDSCWCLRLLGGLRAAKSLSDVDFKCCPSLDLTGGEGFIPLSLDCVRISECMLADDSFVNGLLHLEMLAIRDCRTPASLSIGHLTSLESLYLSGLPDLCFLEGLSSLQLQRVSLSDVPKLKDVPKLSAECISQFHVHQSLLVDNSELLNRMLSDEGFTFPPKIILSHCKEPTLSFEESANLSSVKVLHLVDCLMKSLPTNMKCLSSLQHLDICSCPNISYLPDLPSSLQRLTITSSKLLSESCRAPDGESWPKISHIRWKRISDQL